MSGAISSTAGMGSMPRMRSVPDGSVQWRLNDPADLVVRLGGVRAEEAGSDPPVEDPAGLRPELLDAVPVGRAGSGVEEGTGVPQGPAIHATGRRHSLHPINE